MVRRIMKKRRLIKIISWILISSLGVCAGISSLHQKTYAKESRGQEVLSNGTYTIKGIMRSASSDQASMGNAAVVQPMQLISSNGKLTLRMECKSLTTNLGSQKFSGYLAKFNYFPDWEGGTTGIEPPKDQVAEPVRVEAYYKNVYDSYNDPNTGSDSQVKGKLYPHYLNMPVNYKDDEIWVQVYVPVMEGISKGSGLQYARLQLSWDTLKKTSDEVIDLTGGEATSVDKSGLKFLILSASSLAEREDTYTSATLKKLNKAITAAKNVYSDPEATQQQVNSQMSSLSSAIKGLKEKGAAGTSKTSAGKKLDINNLEDGIYAVTGTMQKTDKKSTSMSDDAVNHTIQLTVKNGKYYLTLDFKGLKINSQFGYLSRMKYYMSGYSLDRYGAPKGTLKSVTIDSYQKDSEDRRVKDAYGSGYPNKVTFPLISEAKKNGYVPLQLFVPVMESISPGSGTQAVFLKLDWNSIKTKNSAADFEDNQSDDTENSGTKTAASGSAMGNTKLPTGGKAKESTALSSGNTGTEIQTGTAQAVEDTQEEGSGAAAVPSVMSILSALGGIFYKVKSRGL